MVTFMLNYVLGLVHMDLRLVSFVGQIGYVLGSILPTDGFDPSEFVPKDRPEGSGGFVRVARMFVGWALIVGTGSALVGGVLSAGIGWVSKKHRESCFAWAGKLLMTAVALGLITLILSAVTSIVEDVLTTFNG